MVHGGLAGAGFNQAPFFNGGTAADLLRAEFGEVVQRPLLTEVADLFDGLWDVLPSEPLVDLEDQAAAQRATTIAAALDDLAEAVRRHVKPPGGIGHNSEDLAALSEDDQRLVLKASADARLAVLSSDYSAAAGAWEAVKPDFAKVGAAIIRYVDTFLNKAAATSGIAMALGATGFCGYLIGLWDKAQAITSMLDFAEQFIR